MTAYPFEDRDEKPVIYGSIATAFVLESLLLTAFGWHSHWLAHPPKVIDADAGFIEARIFELPPEAQLVAPEKKIASKIKEATISKAVEQGRKAKADEKVVMDENQTQSGGPQAPTHGPVAIFSPPPQIPSYLQDKELHASVVIDFFVAANGTSNPRLVGSSGNEELDAIALAAVRKWQFRAAEDNHHPVDSKVRLRIQFEVQ
jgi:TonB family protein